MRSIAEGIFEDGLLQGFGRFMELDDDQAYEIEGGPMLFKCWVGFFNKGKLHGKGIYYENEDYKIGMWRDGVLIDPNY